LHAWKVLSAPDDPFAVQTRQAAEKASEVNLQMLWQQVEAKHRNEYQGREKAEQLSHLSDRVHFFVIFFPSTFTTKGVSRNLLPLL
jgi:hypothetical protein